jgi:predicted house-cleaning noncanonical NTP pyrophosphatase (MazG superfamily)
VEKVYNKLVRDRIPEIIQASGKNACIRKADEVAKDVYNYQSRNYLLGKLENFGRKEKMMVGNYTIEHIMPQNNNLSLEWRKELGDSWKDVQANYLHTIGNLTLTGYNSELSDRPFNEKRDMKGGFADSPLHLNKNLANLDTWNEEEIKKRAEELSKAAVEVWPIPEYKDIEDYKITAKEMLINVFPAEKDLVAAKEIIQEIARIVDLDQAQHILSVTYRDGNMISVNLGNEFV